MIECQLSDKLQQDILTMTGHTVKDDVDNQILKFDDRGTLHILGYDKEGKRIDDCALKNSSVSYVPEERNLEKSLSEAKDKTLLSKRKSNIANVFLILLGVITIVCLITLLR